MFGNNSWGQLGDKTIDNRSTPINITANIIESEPQKQNNSNNE